MKFVLMFFILCVCVVIDVYAQSSTEGIDFDNSDPELDVFYQRGSFLVYDCNTDHWVCTKTLEYKRCKSQRKEALLDLEERLPCAFFDQFKTDELCAKEQQRLTNDSRGNRFCLHPNEQMKMRDY
jgi:hypothetical protein